jgi:hypothetical protein
MVLRPYGLLSPDGRGRYGAQGPRLLASLGNEYLYSTAVHVALCFIAMVTVNRIFHAAFI